ncbi:MAG: peptidyl-prolyl cis-trans isomerase [Candidatus Omnitrophota bacterium]|nr:peptidyl-prolyl cis-trans isomerase [Candidatus Omnitrophota bacterium]
MIKLKIITLLFFFFLSPFSLNCFAQDKIIAVVNEDVVTQKDLDDFIRIVHMQLSGELKGRQLEEKVQSMKINLIEKLIEDRLILQEAKKNNIKADENRVRAKADEIRARYSCDAEFQKAISREGLSEADIEKKIREQMLSFSIVEQKVRSKIIIDPKAVTNFYEQNKNKFGSPQERRLESVIFENEGLVRDFSADLKRGRKLTDLAGQYSVAINEFIVNEEEELKKDVQDAVFKLELNEVSSPVEIEGKYYIFRLIDIIPSKQLTIEEAQHRISSFLFETKMRQELIKWLDELKKKSYIKIM